MRVTTGRVVNGKIEVSDEELTEGMVVTILAPEDRGTFTLGPEAEAALLASIEEADRGDAVDLMSLYGIVKPSVKGVTLADMDEAVRRGEAKEQDSAKVLL